MSASEKFLVATADMQPSFAGRVTILAPSTDDIRYGDVISATAKIMPPDRDGAESRWLYGRAHCHRPWPRFG